MTRSAAPFWEHLSDPTVEEAVILLLDSEGGMLSRLSYTGVSDRIELPLRDIILQALQADCRGMILMHSHPSEATEPSAADIAVTRLLCNLLRPLEIKLLDHVVMTKEHSFSFRDNGLL